MVKKVETSREEVKHDLQLAHADIVDMVNDPQVDLDADSDQEFELILKRANGSEILLKTLTSTDTLVIRFTTVVEGTTDIELNGVDVS